MSETVYIETSILGYLTARPSRDIIVSANIEITREWWNIRRTDFQLYSSQAVVKETSQGDTAVASQRLEIISNLSLLLTFPVKSKIQQCKHLDPLSGKALRHNSLDRRK